MISVPTSNTGHTINARDWQSWAETKITRKADWGTAEVGSHLELEAAELVGYDISHPKFMLVRQQSHQILQDIKRSYRNFDSRNRVIIVVGASGSGKSTDIHLFVPALLHAGIPVMIATHQLRTWIMDEQVEVLEPGREPSFVEHFAEKKGVAFFDAFYFPDGFKGVYVEYRFCLSILITSPNPERYQFVQKNGYFVISQPWTISEVRCHQEYLDPVKKKWKKEERERKKAWEVQRKRQKAEGGSRKIGGESEEYQRSAPPDSYFHAPAHYNPTELAAQFGTNARDLFEVFPLNRQSVNQLDQSRKSIVEEFVKHLTGSVFSGSSFRTADGRAFDRIGKIFHLVPQPLSPEKTFTNFVKESVYDSEEDDEEDDDEEDDDEEEDDEEGGHLAGTLGEAFFTFEFVSDYVKNLFYLEFQKLDRARRLTLCSQLSSIAGFAGKAYELFALDTIMDSGINEAQYRMRDRDLGHSPPSTSRPLPQGTSNLLDAPNLDQFYIPPLGTPDYDAFFVVCRDPLSEVLCVVYLQATIAEQHSFKGERMKQHIQVVATALNVPLDLIQLYYILVVKQEENGTGMIKAKTKEGAPKIQSSLRVEGKEIKIHAGFVVFSPP